MNRPVFELDARLRLCASMVRGGKKLADIGTDHAYLPIWLVRQGIVPSAVAADVNPGPLGKAALNVRRYHVENEVSVRLSDGLDAVSPQEADDIVLAGMGGELIARLIAGTPWLESGEKRLILQPMTSAKELRLFLADAGYSVVREEAVLSGRHVYAAMLAVYGPKQTEPGELYPYIGILTGETGAGRAYLQKQASALQKRAQGLRAEGKEEDARELFRLADRIGGLIRENTEGRSQA